MSPNHKNLQKPRGSQPLKSAGKRFLMEIGLNRKRNDTSNKSGVRQGVLYKVSFKLGPIVFELASNTTRSFVELWLSLMTA